MNKGKLVKFKILIDKANLTISKINEYIAKNGSTDHIESIKQQIIFIRDNAKNSKNPSVELGDRKFT